MTTTSEEAALDAIERRAIDSEFSHLWSDALFAREQARERVRKRPRIEAKIAGCGQASRLEAELRQIEWDIGSFVRWTVVTGWMPFHENRCQSPARSLLWMW